MLEKILLKAASNVRLQENWQIVKYLFDFIWFYVLSPYNIEGTS